MRRMASLASRVHVSDELGELFFSLLFGRRRLPLNRRETSITWVWCTSQPLTLLEIQMHRAKIVSGHLQEFVRHSLYTQWSRAEGRRIELAAVTEDIRSYPSPSFVFYLYQSIHLFVDPELLTSPTGLSDSYLSYSSLPCIHLLPRPLLCLCNSIGRSLATKTHLIIALWSCNLSLA